MSKKYLEALNDLFDLVTCQGSFEKAQRCFDIVEEALQRLESIDNANPSEALECLEQFINEMTRCLENPKEYVKGYEKQIFWKYKNTLETTIKQALLKAQEPKQYLKWEDLEFSYGTKTQKVRMSGNIYKIAYRRCDDIKEVQLLSEDEKYYYLGFTGNYKDNVQLFNDLHLERVEE